MQRKSCCLPKALIRTLGARPLKRAIQKLVQDPLALKILDGEVLHGDHVIVDADKKAGKMTFKVSERVGEPAAAKK